jgi:pimeloyl-ACP methyl ester carboxylesterase
MDDVSHFLMLDDPARFNSTLDSFLDSEVSNQTRGRHR